ncbi:hypothetical protein ACU635_34640 [[Actinomadura] parvosata]|uniref:hypothetical protein n=1 Tax=[Actinomadura] parvosata TaxID=1955412 RepID=UPI00406CCF68
MPASSAVLTLHYVMQVGVAATTTPRLLAGASPPATATATATVARQTLNDTRDADGELGYGPVTRCSTGPLDP